MVHVISAELSFRSACKKWARRRLLFQPQKALVSRGVLYFPIAKVANSYLSALFLANSDAKHNFDPTQDTALSYWAKGHNDCLVKGSILPHLITNVPFAVLRDPAKRLVSGFLNKFARSNEAGARNRVALIRDLERSTNRRCGEEDISFSSFAHYICSLPDFRREHHFRSQTSYLLSPSTRTFAIEDWEAIKIFLRGFGFRTDLPHNLNSAVVKKTEVAQASGTDRVFDIPLSHLKQMNTFPPYESFFNPDISTAFERAFARDLRMYRNACKRSASLCKSLNQNP